MEMDTKKFIGVALLIGLFTINFNYSKGQDIHFSQFFETPLLINPANTGIFNGDIRGILNYKNQWTSINNPFTTSLFSFDTRILEKKWSNVFLGTGLIIYNDKAGKSEFGTTQINLSISASVAINEKSRLSAGLNGGFAQKGIKNTDLRWGNQYNSTDGIYDPSMSSGETNHLNTETFMYGDFGGGLAWYFTSRPTNMTSNDRISGNLGVALFHLNKPKQELYVGEYENLYSKLVIHCRTYIGIPKTTLAVLPSFMYTKQKTANEIIFGGMLRYGLKEESKYTGLIKESAILIGSHYRLGDAFIPSILLEVSSFALGISYDKTLSKLNSTANINGGIEISLRFINPSPFKKQSGGAMF